MSHLKKNSDKEHLYNALNITDATKQNLVRKSYYVDRVQEIDGTPIFSWIDINVTELCNRKCVFCPRVDPDFYPNLNLHMSVELATKIADELQSIDYTGSVVFSGYSEPTLCPHFEDIIRVFPKTVRLELVTNGDNLSAEDFMSMDQAGIDHFIVSLYDGEHQIKHFKDIFEAAGLNEDAYTLRDRWHTSDDAYGLKLTNRAGVVEIGDQPEVVLTDPCNYPAYSMTLDWNGDVLLCVQDWNKKIKFGNVGTETLMEIWTSKALHKYRMRLLGGSRNCSPCNKCNTDGTLHGFNHKDAWNAVQNNNELE
ncbi:SPASM domain-containing protein [Planktomarina temperata]|nr:SPASM domain-containing protein [Planktomarina temperata]